MANDNVSATEKEWVLAMAGSPLILAVDDQVGVRRLVEEVFKLAGYRVRTAAHGREALALIAEERPDLVLLDMRMPVMDGLETLRVLRRRYPELPVMVMTAVDDSDQVNETMAAGAQCCITKPFDVFKLRQIVEEALLREAASVGPEV